MILHPETASTQAMGGRSSRGVRLLLALIPLAAGLLALALGQDASWDLRNYHFYNAFSYLTDRMGHDVAAAQVATYYNPLMHLPLYYAVTSLPPRMVGFLLGFIPGFGALLLYAIAKNVTHPSHGTDWFCLATALTGFLGANGIAELGTSFGDNILSLPMLAALWLILRFRDRFADSLLQGSLITLVAGLSAGAAFGLKQPFAVYCVGLCLAFFGLDLPLRRRVLLAIVFGIGVLAGAAATGGFWMMEMWWRFQNPLFPYFNQHFHSSWIADASYRDERFLPKGPLMALFFPLIFTVNPMQVGEIVFRDTRFAVLYVLLILWLIFWIGSTATKRLRATNPMEGEGTDDTDFRAVRRFLLIFMGISFFLWMRLFSVYRYIAVCEMLAPLVIFLVMNGLTRTPRCRTRLTLVCFLVILATLLPGNWGRRPWASEYFGVTPPPIPYPAHTLVLMTGYEPMAYMIPFFPPEVRFLRIHSYMTGPSAHPNGMDRLMRDAIAAHQGDIFLLYREYEEKTALDVLAAYGLKTTPDEYARLAPHVEPHPEAPFYFRPVTKNQ